MHVLLLLVIPAAVVALGYALKVVAQALLVYATSKAIVRVAALPGTGAEDAAKSIAIALGPSSQASDTASGRTGEI